VIIERDQCSVAIGRRGRSGGRLYSELTTRFARPLTKLSKFEVQDSNGSYLDPFSSSKFKHNGNLTDVDSPATTMR
jgi:hypothetical protein